MVFSSHGFKDGEYSKHQNDVFKTSVTTANGKGIFNIKFSLTLVLMQILFDRV